MLSVQQQLQEDDYIYPYHWAKSDDTRSGRLYFGYLRLCREVSLNLKNADENLKILEVGCGDARFLKELQDHGYKNLHGSDYSEKAISFAKSLLPGITFSVDDFTQRTHFSEESFDVVFLIETLEHIEPQKVRNLITEVARILKKNGEFIISVPSDRLPPGPKHYQHFSANSIRVVLENVFSPIEVIGQDKMGFHLLKILDKLFDNTIWLIKPLAKYYNKKVWPRYFNRCSPSEGRRIIVRTIKSVK